MKRVMMFDSGVGGLSVFDALAEAGLAVAVDYLADAAWLPYGAKPPEAIRARVPALLAAAAAQLEPDLIVMACNTASTIALAAARAAIAQPIVGVVPPIKPAAAASKTGTIGLLATPATASGPYVDDLIAQFAAGARVIRFGSTALVAAAEAKLAGRAPDPAALTEAVEGLFGAECGAAIDVVALACTHFPLLRDDLAAAAPQGVLWLDSGAAIARRVAALLHLEPGADQVRARRALTTGASVSAPEAFGARGFGAFGLVDSGFAIAPAPASGLA